MKKAKDFFGIILGSLIYAIGISVFLNPADIAPGGISGISIILNHLFNIPIGILTLVINIPIIIIGCVYLDPLIIKKSFAPLIISSVIIDLITQPYFPKYTGDRLIGSVFGGMLMGVGIGIIFNRGRTTGGTDIISLLLKKKIPHIRIGIAMLITDSLILTTSVIIFENIETGLYGIITVYTSAKFIDYIVYAGEKTTLVFIFSEKSKNISADISLKLDRGFTFLNGIGGYSEKNRQIIMCAVKKQEFPILKDIVKNTDENAFITAVSCEGIFGEGFSDKTNI